MKDRSNRKKQVGVVISDKMEKTVVVKVTKKMRHQKYEKVFERSQKFYAHDELNTTVGQTVCIMETRPLSKQKGWRLVKILERAK